MLPYYAQKNKELTYMSDICAAQLGHSILFTLVSFVLNLATVNIQSNMPPAPSVVITGSSSSSSSSSNIISGSYCKSFECITTSLHILNNELYDTASGESKPSHLVSTTTIFLLLVQTEKKYFFQTSEITEV